MTEESYQQGRKVMQRANILRGLITGAKGEVAKWTKIEDGNRQEMRPGQADGANKKLKAALVRLDEVRQEFADLNFPRNNLTAPPVSRSCAICDQPLAKDAKKCPSCETIIHS